MVNCFFYAWTYRNLQFKKLSSQTCRDQSELVFLIPNFLFLHISSRKEKSHHPFEELVHELNGKWHHIYLQTKNIFFLEQHSYCINHKMYITKKIGFHNNNLKVFLDGDPSHWRADLTEDAECQLASWLAGTLRTQDHLQHRTQKWEQHWVFT